MLTNRSGKSKTLFKILLAWHLICAQTLIAQTLGKPNPVSGLEIAARPNSPQTELNFKLCWHNPAIEIAANLLAADDKILLPQSNGALLALNAADGKTAWRSDLGGEIVGQPVATDNFVFVANKIGANQTDAVVFVRAVSLATGLTAWRVELPKTFDAKLGIAGDKLLVVENGENPRNKQQIIALNAADGAPNWSTTVDAAPTSPLEVAANSIYFAASDDYLRVLRLNDGAPLKRLRLPHRATNLQIVENGLLLIRDATGLASAIRLRDAKKLWTLRLGGAVQQILVARDNVLLSSLDDFVYSHNLASGKRRWFKRFAARPLGATLIGEQAMLLAVAGENNAALLDSSAGKTLGQITFPADAYAVQTPIFTNNRLIAATSRGVAVWQSENAACAAP